MRDPTGVENMPVHWQQAHCEFLEQPGTWERHVPWARQDRVLPISTRWDYTFAVDDHGFVWATLDEDIGGELTQYYPNCEIESGSPGIDSKPCLKGRTTTPG